MTANSDTDGFPSNAQIVNEIDVERLSSECGLGQSEVRSLIDWIEASMQRNISNVEYALRKNREYLEQRGDEPDTADRLPMLMVELFSNIPSTCLLADALPAFARKYGDERVYALVRLLKREREDAAAAVAV